MEGTIQFMEPGSFKGNDGNMVSFTSVVVDGVKYTCYNKSMKEKKVGDTVQFDKVDKGEGKTPQMKLVGEPKKEWKPQDPDGMYRCNASDKATQILIASQIPIGPTAITENQIVMWDRWYDHIYAKMKGEAAPVSTPAVAKPQVVAQNTTTDVKVLASESQKNAIKNMSKARKMSTDDFLTESLGYGAPLEELSKGEASMAIGFWNKKDEQGEPF